jgi:hypothetical protein
MLRPGLQHQNLRAGLAEEQSRGCAWRTATNDDYAPGFCHSATILDGAQRARVETGEAIE